MIEMNRKIIITRDVKKSAPLVAMLEPYGILSYVVPVTQTVFDSSRTIPENLNEFNYIAFTSANAVDVFSEILNKSGIKLGQGIKIFAVGSSTAAVAERVIRKPDLVPEKNDAASLAEVLTRCPILKKSCRGRAPVLPAGNVIEPRPSIRKISGRGFRQ